MKKTKGARTWAAFFLLPVFFLFSGCSFVGLDAKTLMSPPKANPDQQSIHSLLQGSRPGITFIYPKSGEFRSAIIMRDLNGDGQQEAIGFYALEDDSVEVQFLSKQNGEWATSATFKNTATQVDRVCFGDLNGDGYEDALIGWGRATGSTGRTASVCAYLYDSAGDIAEHSLGTYGEMVVTDFDRDGINELFTADKFIQSEQEGEEPLPAKAQVYGYRDGKIVPLLSTPADNNISTYSSISFGRLSPTLYGVLLDGAKADSSMTTQVFYIDSTTGTLSGMLLNMPGKVNESDYSNPFSRPTSAFLSRDINTDGLLDIPIATLLPGIPESVTPDATSYLVEWVGYEHPGRTRTILFALMNPADNYWFRLPYEMKDKISASYDPAKRTVTYMEVIPGKDKETSLLGSPLFSIRVFTLSSWQSRGESSGYERLASQGDTVYGMQVLTKEASFLESITRIKHNFMLLSE